MGWPLKGELILNCKGKVFRPCVVSLGKQPPTEGYRQVGLGGQIDQGDADGEDLSGLKVDMVLDIPGNIGRGNWTARAFSDASCPKL